MSKIWLGPTGRLSSGHVLDVSKSALERTLRDYDSQLYVKWNPRKLRGYGCWEVRRRPNTKTVAAVTEFQGISYVTIDYLENDFESHILDVPSLNYDVLTRLKAMDVWNVGREHFVDLLESRERSYKAEVEAKAKAEMRYQAKQYRSMFKQFREDILSGLNPAQIADYWGKQGQ